MTPGRPAVLSVVGPGRSGTTILGNILGELPGWFATGELRWFWQRGLVERRRCGCGRELPGCAVWSHVIGRLERDGYDLDTTAQAPAGSRQVSVRSVIAWQRELGALKARARILRSPRTRPRWPALAGYTAATADLVRATVDVTRARVVVDTSKRAHDAAVVAGIGGIDHYVVQMVRDPRAVAHSWGRVKALPGVATQSEMGRRTPLSSVARWTENCLGAELLRREAPPERWLLLRYEDFVRDPRTAVERILALVGDPGPRTLPVDEQRSVTLGGNHNVAGNPNRFETGPVVVRADEEWRRAMGRGDMRQVTAVALPFLKRFGYPVRVPA